MMPIRPKTLLSFTSLFPLFTKNNLLRPCILKGRYGGAQYHNVCATAMNGSCKPPAYLATHRASGTHARPSCAFLQNSSLSEYMYTYIVINYILTYVCYITYNMLIGLLT